MELNHTHFEQFSGKQNKINMEEKLIKFETAKLANEKGVVSDSVTGLFWLDGGFDWEERHIFYKNQSYSRPTQAILQKLLREEHSIDVDILTSPLGYAINIWKDKKLIISSILIAKYYKEFEEALEVGLCEALKLIKI